RTYALSSSFRPTYNMACNLVRRYPADTAHHLLNLSFAQYRADRDIVRLETQLERSARVVTQHRAEARCDLGDVADYRRLLREVQATGPLRAPARAEKDVRRLERRIRGRTESLARQFDRVLRILGAWGYVDGWSLTENGDQLSRIYHECDLLVSESLRAGLFDDLDPAATAGLASCF